MSLIFFSRNTKTWQTGEYLQLSITVDRRKKKVKKDEIERLRNCSDIKGGGNKSKM